jgi:wyosine [tRNA(Phe)-imidazoG37] synthetase (radical SAM superfamily)
MKNTANFIAFGPVPSRRLGQSLGINNIPPKSCTYSCIYCQVGRTTDMRIDRKEFYRVDDIRHEVGEKISNAGKRGEAIDHLTFVPDGEPTLDINLGREIEALKDFGINIAVITNASLSGEKSVREDLCRADRVSVKIDAITEDAWRGINRPHKALKSDDILKGITGFANMFRGVLTTETMLVRGFNDGQEELKKIAEFIRELKPHKSYISIPTRPPAEKEARSPEGDAVNAAYQIFSEKGIDTEYLIGYEGNTFAFTADARKDLLSITAVHPMKEEAVRKFLNKAGAGWETVDDMIEKGELLKVCYRNQQFYVRKR